MSNVLLNNDGSMEAHSESRSTSKSNSSSHSKRENINLGIRSRDESLTRADESALPCSRNNTITPKNPPKDDLESLKNELITQENIICTLQDDNEGLREENKALHRKIKELEERNANLEAKKSIQASARKFSLGRSDDKDTTISSLRLTVNELKAALQEAEKIKSSMRNQISSQTAREKRVMSCSVQTEDQRESMSEEMIPGDFEGPPVAENDQPQALHSTSQAFEYRLVEQLRSTIDHQKEEIAVLRRESQKLMNSVARKKPIAEESSPNSTMGEKRHDLASFQQRHESGSEESSVPQDQVNRLRFRIRQLEEALGEKDKCAQIAVEKLGTETARIRSYYENAIKSIVSLTKAEERKKETSTQEKEEKPSAELLSLENTTLKHQVQDMEKQLSLCFSREAYNKEVTKVEHLTKEVTELKKERENLWLQMEEKKEELHAYQIKSKEELLFRIESLREQHNAEINKIQEQHDGQLRRLASCKISKEFADKLKKKWLRLRVDHPETFLTSVIERITFLENYCVQKDAEMELNIGEILRVAEMERKIQKEKAEMALEGKNLQIEQFQYQLDRLLRSVELLKHSDGIFYQ